MRRGGEGSGRAGGGSARADGLAAVCARGRSDQTPGTTRAKKQKNIHRPSFSKEKTQNLGFRMFFRTLALTSRSSTSRRHRGSSASSPELTTAARGQASWARGQGGLASAPSGHATRHKKARLRRRRVPAQRTAPSATPSATPTPKNGHVIISCRCNPCHMAVAELRRIALGKALRQGPRIRPQGHVHADGLGRWP
jgi:hypothetical protein